MRSTLLNGSIAAYCLIVAGCGGPGSNSPAVRPIDNPAPPGSSTPNLASGLDGGLYMSWIEERGEGHALRFTRWRGDGWDEPKTIAEGNDWFVNWADFPSMAALADGTLAAHWLVRSGEETYAYDVVVALSRDGGTTWSEPLRPHDDGTKTEHGFASIVPTREGRFDLIWLDGRHTARDPRGAMTLRYARLTPDGTIETPAEIDPRVCDCCATDATIVADGRLLTVYRDRSDVEIRDVSVARHDASGWSTPAPVHDDGWEIAGCPVNGPAVASSGEAIAVAWFTAAGGDPAVRVAFSEDGGESFGAPFDVDDGAPIGRVDIVAQGDGSALVSWLERTDGGARILVRRVSPGGASAPEVVAATSAARSSGFPRVARLDDELFVAWTETGDRPVVRTALLPIERDSR